MLRRNSSKRLSRSKSASSFRSQHDTTKPELARQHAHTAANLAFARAQERFALNAMPKFQNNPGQKTQKPLSHTDAINNAERTVRRQHSVRFVGPNAVQRRRSLNSRGVHSQVISPPSSTTLIPTALTTNAPVPAAYRPPSRSSSLGKGSLSKATAENLATAHIEYEKLYSLEDDLASTPSSYRRIRRSKSMFSPLKAPSIFYTNGTPDRQNSPAMAGRSNVNTLQTSCGKAPQVPLRAPKSLNFLRGNRNATATATRERNDAAVQMARDRFFHQASQQRLREQPSFLFRSKSERQEKPFRQSVRSSSINSYGMPVSSFSSNLPQRESSMKDAARKASRNIRNKLKRVFGRGNLEPIEIPNQQVDAKETHVRGYASDRSRTHDQFSDIPHPTPASLTQAASRVPSVQAEISSQNLRSQPGSVRSVTISRDDEQSRVTSWNSTGMNTITSHTARLAEREQQHRLSIINENGTHVSGSSFSRPMVANQFSADPLIPTESNDVHNLQPPLSSTVDSARVYSALMKRLDENSPKAKLEASRKASWESPVLPTYAQLPGSSVSYSSNTHKPATIRCVTPTVSNDCSNRTKNRVDSSRNGSEGRSRERLTQNKGANDGVGRLASTFTQLINHGPLLEVGDALSDDVFSPKGFPSDRKENNPTWQVDRPPSTRSGMLIQNSSKRLFEDNNKHQVLTPQELACRNESLVPGTKVVREARSTFFGGSSSITVSRTPSPFRRALAEAEYEANTTSVQTQLYDPVSPPRNPLFTASKSSLSTENGFQHPTTTYSESVYSRTSSGHIPVAANITMSVKDGLDVIPHMPSKILGNGDAVIIGRTTYRHLNTANNGHRVNDSAGSTEWRKWMSSEIAKLERDKENNDASSSYINYALPTMPRSFNGGHVRESAQILDDDTNIAQPRAPTVKQPLGMIQHNPNLQKIPLLKPILKNRSVISLPEKAEPVSTLRAIPTPPPPPPPIPVRSPLRPARSKSSLKSMGMSVSAYTASIPPSLELRQLDEVGRNVLHKRNVSSVTLRSTTTAEASAKLVKRTKKPFVASTKHSTIERVTDIALNKDCGDVLKNLRILDRGTERYGKVSEQEDPYNSYGAGLMGPRKDFGDQVGETEAQAIGSRKMVDLFLSSRRRRIASASDESGRQVFL